MRAELPSSYAPRPAAREGTGGVEPEEFILLAAPLEILVEPLIPEPLIEPLAGPLLDRTSFPEPIPRVVVRRDPIPSAAGPPIPRQAVSPETGRREPPPESGSLLLEPLTLAPPRRIARPQARLPLRSFWSFGG